VNPRATAPFYLPGYPTSSTVPANYTLNCKDTTETTTENCPDHGPAVAGLAQLFEPGVYGAPGTAGTVARSTWCEAETTRSATARNWQFSATLAA
jgi:hypothetical protein